MRYTVADVLRRRTFDALVGWWEECPWRSLRNFRTLLFAEGRGWLRWGRGRYTEHVYEDGYIADEYEMGCFPPLRRLFLPVRDAVSWVGHGFGWHYDEDGFGWHRLTWEEHHISLSEAWSLRDPDWPYGFTVAPPKGWGVRW